MRRASGVSVRWLTALWSAPDCAASSLLPVVSPHSAQTARSCSRPSDWPAGTCLSTAARNGHDAGADADTWPLPTPRHSSADASALKYPVFLPLKFAPAWQPWYREPTPM